MVVDSYNVASICILGEKINPDKSEHFITFNLDQIVSLTMADRETLDFIKQGARKRERKYDEYFSRHGTPAERAQGWTRGVLTHQGTDKDGNLMPINANSR